LQPSTLAKRVTPLLFLAIIVFYLYGLGHLPLLGPDEPRYAQVAREMFLRGDFVTPTLGAHTWFEKPALLYWLMMISYKLFGVSEWSARLGPALCGLLTIAAVWTIGRRLQSEEYEDFGTWSALIAASAFGLIVFARAASFDIVITMTSAWALSFFIRQELAADRRARRLLLAGFYCFVGLSLLAKGLVGIVIPFGVVTFYYLVKRRWPNKDALLSLVWGIPIAVVVASLWYGPVISRHGWTFIDEFFIQHHLNRFVSNKYHHPQPIWFFPVIALMLVVPWSPFLIDSLMRLRRWTWQSSDSLNSARMFSLVWLLLPVAFFSVSGSKLPGYILPVLPAAALLISERVASIGNPGTPRWPLRASAVLCILLAIIGVVYAVITHYFSIGCAVAAGVPLLLAGIFALVTKSQSKQAVIALGLSCLFSLVIVLNCAAPQLAQRDSVRDLLKLGDARGYANAPVLAQKGDDRSAEFYASGRVVYGPSGEPRTIDELTQEDLKKLGERVLVFVPVEYVDQFKVLPHVEVIGDNGRMVLLGWTTEY
jgi:4-amino-4-deoxy-L-arabinose transferase-like glycosyltransferase